MFRLSYYLVILLIGIVTTSTIAARLQQNGDSEPLLRALNVLNRKQRSLNAAQQGQNYYNKLRSRKYEDEPYPEEDEDDDVDFLSLDNGQLETIGNGFQRLNNKRLEKALINYLKTAPPQREPASSLFRERERLGGHKREIYDTEIPTMDNNDNEELAEIFLDVLRNSPIDSNDEEPREHIQYQPLDVLQSISRKYQINSPNKLNSHDEFVPWTDIDTTKHKFYNEEDLGAALDRLATRPNEPEDYLPYEMPQAGRRNAKERYLSGREYRSLVKRFPVVKRSAMSHQKTTKNLQNTDPKVAEDLSDLFGTHIDLNSSKPINNAANQSPISTKTVVKTTTNTSNGPTTTTTTTTHGENEIEPTILSSKNSRDSIQIRNKKSHSKKSVDWSEYFGIDRRRKKAEFLARPGSTEQDDEWLLQRYYKTMADNLKSHSAGTLMNVDKSTAGEKRDKLDQMDERLKNVKNLIMRDAAKYTANEDTEDSQRVKDIIMSRLAAAYSLEKMRRALNEFKNSITSEKAWTTATTSTSPVHDTNTSVKQSNLEKKNGIKYEGIPHEGFDEGKIITNNNNCPELEAIERSCKPARNLYGACVKQQICKICHNVDECINEFAVDATRQCNDLNSISREYCMQTALLMSQMQIPSIINRMSVCFEITPENSCLRHYQNRSRHHFNYNSYAARRHNNNDARDDGELDSPMERWL